MITLTEKKWDRFSKYLKKERQLHKWRKWFTDRGKKCEIKLKGGRYALYVEQRWYIAVNDSNDSR